MNQERDIPDAVRQVLRKERIEQDEAQPFISYLEQSASDFDRHWQDNDLLEIPAVKKEVAERFLAPLQDYLAGQSEPCLILDAGCGDGVHTAFLPAADSDDQCIGLDISAAALAVAARRARSGWTFVHGDAGDVPIEDGTIDAVFSFGVLAYTDNPPHSFRELCRVLKPGGLVGIWILPDEGGLVHSVLKLLRGICRVTGPRGARFLANCIVPFLRFISTRSGMHLGNSTWEQCREVVLVDLAPEQLFFPKAEEVRSWFEEQGLEIVAEDVDQPVTLWGRRPEQ